VGTVPQARFRVIPGLQALAREEIAADEAYGSPSSKQWWLSGCGRDVRTADQGMLKANIVFMSGDGPASSTHAGTKSARHVGNCAPSATVRGRIKVSKGCGGREDRLPRVAEIMAVPTSGSPWYRPRSRAIDLKRRSR